MQITPNMVKQINTQIFKIKNKEPNNNHFDLVSL